MANIVEYILDLKTKKAQTGLDEVNSKTKVLTGSLKVMTGAIVGMGAAFAAASASFLSFAQSQADVINDLNDLSTRSGVSAKNINALKLAFVASGQAAGQVQQLLDKMPKVLANIERGVGNSKKAFDGLNLELHDTAGEMKDADTVFSEMVEAIQAIESPTKKATVAADLFGRQAGNLLQAFGTQESLQKFVAITERFGADIGPEASDQAAKFQQAIGVLSQVTERFGQVFAKIFGVKGFIAPLQFGMEVIVELTNVIDNSVTFVRALIPRLEAEFELGMAKIKKELLDFKDLATTFVSQFLGVSIDVTQLQEDRKEAFREIRAIEKELQNLIDIPELKTLFINIDKKSRKETVDFVDKFNEFLSSFEGGVSVPTIPTDVQLPEKEIEAKWKTIELKKIAQIQLDIEELTVDIDDLGDDFAERLDTLLSETIAAGIAGLSELLASGPEKMTAAIISGFGPAAEIIADSIGKIAELGQPVVDAISASIDRTIDLSTSSMGDILKAQDDAVEKLAALQKPDSREAAAAERVAKVEQKIQAETLRKELAALRGAGGQDMQMAREIAMLEAEIQAVTFSKALGEAIQALPGMLLRILPSMLFDMARAIIEAIISLPSRIWEALQAGFRSVVDALTLGLGDKMESAGESIKDTAKSIGDWFRSIGSGQAGLRFTGSQSGLHLLHPREVVVPESGRKSQAIGKSMAEQIGGGGINISINSLVTERSAIDELVRQVERRFYTYGNSTSPLFN